VLCPIDRQYLPLQARDGEPGRADGLVHVGYGRKETRGKGRIILLDEARLAEITRGR
jgi:hypothetical protein